LSGPLQGLKVIEIAGIGPAPFCAMVLADMGADVIRVERTNPPGSGFEMEPRFEVLNRGRRSVAIDLKRPEGVALLKRLVARADMLFEGFRPGVMERLGVGPEECLAINPRLVYGRMTGFGQTGPMAGAAGHDINYIALTGALDGIGMKDGPPVPPLNLVGDFGGGGMLLALGLLAAHIEATRSGKGQVVDAAMVDGAALLMAGLFGFKAAGMWGKPRGENMLDGGAPWYGTYRTADDRYVSLGAIEPRFYAEFLERAGLAGTNLPAQHDVARWPELRAVFEDTFRGRTLEQWRECLEGSDACFAPVLSMDEVLGHPHVVERGTFFSADGVVQPAPAPRFSRTPSKAGRPPKPGAHTDEVLKDWGIA